MRAAVSFLLSNRPLVKGAHRPGYRAALLAALVALTAAVPARAGYVTATFSGVNPGEVVTINSPLTGTVSGWAGVYNFTNASGDLTGNFSGFCIDIAQAIYTNQTVTFNEAALANAPTPGTAMGPIRANLIAELWANNYAQIGNSNSNAAAFQLSIWEIINGNLNSNNTLTVSLSNGVLSSGTFSAKDSNSATLQTAYNWLKALDGQPPLATNLMALTNSQVQDYVTVAPTPEPPGLVLGGIALAGAAVGAAWRRRRQRTAPLAA
jgi:MYXO-CTERM domain-containing protein